MSKRVVFNFGKGSLEKGFPSVTGELWETDGVRSHQLVGSLPPAPEIVSAYRDWKSLYNALAQRLRGSTAIEIEPTGLTNVSQDDLHSLCQRLQAEINHWLNAESFCKIDKKLRTWLSYETEVQLVIETGDELLWRLPWHLWEFVEDYPQAEVVLSVLDSKRVQSVASTSSNQLRVLAILGDSRGIDISTDKTLLEKLPSVIPKFLVEPERKEINDALWQHSWDILFFAGHSSSQAEDGQAKIYINQHQENNSLSLTQLKYALSKAIKRGLHLAIFNSCDGLGLARQLAELNIPQIIVMREDVPNQVAQEFLKYFLEELVQGQLLAVAVRRARERLQGLENEYPCASWLPMICHNSITEMFTWSRLQPTPNSDRQIQHSISNRKHILIAMLLASVLVSSFVMGVRYLGWLQSSELHSFDQFMQMRSDLFLEKPDNRILIVTIGEDDIKYQIDRGMEMRWSLSDQALLELLQKLDRYQPRAIGLDIYRNYSPSPKYPELATRLQQDNRLVTVCKGATTGDDGETKGIAPPPGVPQAQSSFSDFVEDPEGSVRRHLFQMQPQITSLCEAEYAFSMQLAFQYLHAEGKQIGISKEKYLQIGDVVFKPLEQRVSGYQKIDTSGRQLLLNYRSLASPKKIAEQVSLRDILSDGRTPPSRVNSFKDRIIIIGLSEPTTTNINDFWKTPFSATAQPSQKKIAGVFIQAHMVSQIVSAVLDKRPLLWWWSSWLEPLWVWGWSLLGAILGVYHFKPYQRILAVFIGIISLWSICFAVFIKAGWVPFIPSAVALIVTQVLVIYFLPKNSLKN
jgi:CHASE2 domain-containing sensor protein